jgi:hypothetical protein
MKHNWTSDQRIFKLNKMDSGHKHQGHSHSPELATILVGGIA